MEVICIHSSFVHLCFGNLVRPAWICIQPQSRRSPRCYITIIIRAPSRVFQFQDSQHSFQDCMDYILPGLHWKRFTTPCRRNITAPSTAVAFPYLTAYLQVFCLFIFFGQFAPGRTVSSQNRPSTSNCSCNEQERWSRQISSSSFWRANYCEET